MVAYASAGPAFYMPAALCFYRAIRVYPSPLELIMVYEKSLSPPVFQVSHRCMLWYCMH